MKGAFIFVWMTISVNVLSQPVLIWENRFDYKDGYDSPLSYA